MRPARSRIMAASLAGVGAALLAAVAMAATASSPGEATSGPGVALVSERTPRSAVTPINHVVVIFQENHSFDNVLGRICVTDHLGCEGTIVGTLHDGTIIPLTQPPDIVPPVDHSNHAQLTAIHNGQMNGFDLVDGCTAAESHACYSQYSGSQIPNLKTLAENYVISDHTFTEDPVPSWGGHIDLIAGQLDGFRGDNPGNSSVPPGPGWGCNSKKDTPWHDPNIGGNWVFEPSCIPRLDGFGPYRPSPVAYVPTILDRLDGAGLNWKLYTGTRLGSGYNWSICPTFAECFYDLNNHNRPNPNWVQRTQFATDAASGKLPAYSVILPDNANSQHNGNSMIQGDNYIASYVNDVMTGPQQQWQSTVFFIVYDDCGCFYDHVAPPTNSGLGIRTPMVIVSPQATAHTVDKDLASYSSMLAFVEQNWGLQPLGPRDANAYDYCDSFAFTTLPCTGDPSPDERRTTTRAPLRVPLAPSPVPAASTQYVAGHPPDPNDPS